MAKKRIFFLLSIISIMLLASEAYGKIGVKQGDWAKYDAHFSQDKKYYNEPNMSNFTSNYDFMATLEVLNISGSNLTFKYTNLRPDGSLLIQETLTADPSKPYNDPPLRNIHLFFIPTGLSIGDRIPEPLHEVDAGGNLVFLPFSQRINETISRSAIGVDRQANHVKWKRISEGSGGDGTWIQTIERASYYDGETGLLLEYFQNSSKFYYNLAGVVKSSSHESHRYVIRECSLWGGITRMPWILYTAAGFGVAVTVIATIFLGKRIRSKKECLRSARLAV